LKADWISLIRMEREKGQMLTTTKNLSYAHKRDHREGGGGGGKGGIDDKVASGWKMKDSL